MSTIKKIEGDGEHLEEIVRQKKHKIRKELIEEGFIYDSEDRELLIELIFHQRMVIDHSVQYLHVSDRRLKAINQKISNKKDMEQYSLSRP